MTARYVVMPVADARASGRRAAGYHSEAIAANTARRLNGGKSVGRFMTWAIGPDDTHAIVDTRTAADGSPLPALCECIGERVRTQGDRARCGRCGRQFAIAAADGRDAPAGERRPSVAWRENGTAGWLLALAGTENDGIFATVIVGRARRPAQWSLFAEHHVGDNDSGLQTVIFSDGMADDEDSAKLAAESAAEALLLAALEELRGGRW